MNREEALERIRELEADLEAAEKKLKRVQSVLVWTGWIAALALLGFLLARTLLTRPVEPAPSAPPPPVARPKAPATVEEPKPIYSPPPSVTPPPEMPGF